MYPEVAPAQVPASGYPNPLAGQPAGAPYISPRGRLVRSGEWSTNLCHCCDDPANCKHF